jgi:hypothetical protein
LPDEVTCYDILDFATSASLPSSFYAFLKVFSQIRMSVRIIVLEEKEFIIQECRTWSLVFYYSLHFEGKQSLTLPGSIVC